MHALGRRGARYTASRLAERPTDRLTDRLTDAHPRVPFAAAPMWDGPQIPSFNAELDAKIKANRLLLR